MKATFECGESTTMLNLMNDGGIESNETSIISILLDDRLKRTYPYQATVAIVDHDKGI